MLYRQIEMEFLKQHFDIIFYSFLLPCFIVDRDIRSTKTILQVAFANARQGVVLFLKKPFWTTFSPAMLFWVHAPTDPEEETPATIYISGYSNEIANIGEVIWKNGTLLEVYNPNMLTTVSDSQKTRKIKVYTA